MPTLKSEQQLSVTAAKKAERDRDAAQAMQDYEAEKRAAQANMVRLRALRLKKESADQQAKRKQPSGKTKAAARSKAD